MITKWWFLNKILLNNIHNFDYTMVFVPPFQQRIKSLGIPSRKFIEVPLKFYICIYFFSVTLSLGISNWLYLLLLFLYLPRPYYNVLAVFFRPLRLRDPWGFHSRDILVMLSQVFFWEYVRSNFNFFVLFASVWAPY